MGKYQLLRRKKLLPLLAAVGLAASFSSCNKATDGGTLVNTAWRAEVDDAVIALYFNDDKTCSISNSHKNAYSVNLREYAYALGYGIDLFISEKDGDEKGKTIFTGSFRKQNELTLFGVKDSVAAYEYATLKKIK